MWEIAFPNPLRIDALGTTQMSHDNLDLFCVFMFLLKLKIDLFLCFQNLVRTMCARCTR